MSLDLLAKAYSETGLTGTTWVIKHGLGVQTPVIDCYNNSDVRIMPESIVADSAYQITVTWSASTSGRVYVV